jgi:signal-transduction protein with cAMP-binding, CBS, and nucleotidyltransferase domain
MTISRLEYLDKSGIIIVIRDVTRKDRIRKETDQPIRQAAEFMHRRRQDAILVTKDERYFVGIITDADLRDRVVSREYDTGKPVFEIMSSPLQNITHMISSISDAITERLIEFAIEDMGDPPARFAFVALCSEGLREQTMVTDQDNALMEIRFRSQLDEILSGVSSYQSRLATEFREQS